MTIRFTLRGIAGEIDAAAIVRSNPDFLRARNRMINELNIPAGRADRMLGDMLAHAVLRHADHLIAGRHALVDQVIDLRTRLDGLYGSILNYNPQGGAIGNRSTASAMSIDDQIRQLDQHYRDLDQALTDLGKPLDEIVPPANMADRVPQVIADEIDGTTASTARQDERLIEYDTEVPPRETGLAQKIRIETGRYVFSRIIGPDGKPRWSRKFADDASVRFEVINGRYRVETFDASGTRTSLFEEYDILHGAYARRPRTTAIMQAHHGMQNSLMTRLFGEFGYNGGAAPTVWLRNSRRGSPHGTITDIQNASKPSRARDAVGNPRAAGAAAPGAAPLEARGLAGTTYADIRRWALEDLLMTNMPRNKIKEYLGVFDNYFESTVLPNIPADRRAALLGTVQPRMDF